MVGRVEGGGDGIKIKQRRERKKEREEEKCRAGIKRAFLPLQEVRGNYYG
jgi:hypothetical protein